MPETQPAIPNMPAAERKPDILERIVETKHREIALLAPRAGELEAEARAASRPRDFRRALARPGEVGLIAEIKRRSPGAGPIRLDLDPAVVAAAYQAGGASALSVLTDREYFHGSLEDLRQARAAVDLPVLRKDFLLSGVQLYEARSAGADAVLLITSILEDGELRRLRIQAEELGMAALVEVHDAAEMARALASGATLVGINNRDLRDFTTRLGTTFEVMGAAGDGVVVVSESGIRTRSDVESLGRQGVDAILAGTTLLRAPRPGEKVRELAGAARRARHGG